MKILLVEDDEFVAELLASALSSQHYLVERAKDGQEGWELAEAFEYNLILLDLMLPKLDGLTFCQQRRQQGDRTPILLMTGHDTKTNKVMGLDAGADDYVIKPFDLQEILARIRALLRRGNLTITPIIEWENLRFDPNNCEVTYNGQLLHLTPKEYSLLELFLRNTQRIFSQSALLDHLWSFEEPPSENTVRAHIKSLRQKLKKAGAAADMIETVYGLGYRLKSKQRNQTFSEDKRAGEQENSSAQIQTGEKTGTSEMRPVNPRKLATTSLTPPHHPISQSVLVPAQSQPEIPPELAALWDRAKEKYRQRLAIIEEAVTALLEDNLTEDLRQQALRETHTLAGSLGSFGAMEASRLSREIEEIFQSGAKLSQSQQEHLSKLVRALGQCLERSPTTVEPQTPHPPAIKPQSKLLIVDNDPAVALALVSEATSRGIQAEVASSRSQARIAIACFQPDIVLLELAFANSVDSGFELLEELATAAPPIPVLVFTTEESFANRVKVARLGGQGFLHKPASPTQVIEAIAQILQQSGTPQAKVLVVDDDPQLLDFLCTLLEPWGFNLTLLNDPQQFWNTLEQTSPDLLILDVEMPDFSGIDLCQVVRNDPYWSELPILFLSARTDIDTVHQVFAAGADDYISKPIVGPELVARMLNRLERTQILRKLRKLSAQA